MEENGAWGQLVSLTDIDSEPVLIKGDKFVIGRALDCDVCLSDNRLVSGHHCFIKRDKDGDVTLNDSSTNGTFLNLMYRITKGKSKELKHGDEFYLVYKKNNEELNVGYIFQDLEELKKEESTQEYSPMPALDATLEDTDCNYITPEKITNKRKSDNEEDTPAKRAKVEESTSKFEEPKEIKKLESDTHKPKDIETIEKENEIEDKKSDTSDSKAKVEEKEEKKNDKVPASKPKVEEKDDIEENLQCMICQEIMHDCISLQPCLHSFCAGCYSDWMSRSQECPSCRKNVERINKNHIVNNLIEAYLKEHPGKRRPAEDIEDLNKKNKITTDMLYPKDQKKEDSSDYSDTDDDDDDDDGGGNDFVPPAPAFFQAPVFPPPAPALFGFGTPIFGVNRAFKTVCRQCPDYKESPDTGGIVGGIKTAINTVKNLITGDGDQDKKNATADTPNEPGPSGENKTDKEGEPSTSGEGEPGDSKPPTSDDGAKPFKDDPKVMVTPPDHVCPPNQNHVLCQCCLQPFPDFRTFGTNHANNRPVTCGICYRAYCHGYWGCKKADCRGCLSKFKEMNFGRKALAGLILDNQFESEIFKDYIDSQGLSVKDVLQECSNKMDGGEFTVPAQATHRLTSETPVCYACGLTSFKLLAFQYRKTLRKEDLPAKAQNRPDCYWGSKCRTQKNKPHHARNFNHICDQTRQF